MAKHSPNPLHSSQKKKWLTILQSSAVKRNLGDNQEPLRIVVDTNIWYSAIVHGGNAEQVVLYCLDNAQIVLSSEIVDELYDLFRNTLKAPYRWLNTFLRLLEDICEITDTPDGLATSETDIRDPNDMHVLTAAISSGAQVIITGDKDLLVLRTDQIMILNATDFLLLL